MTGFFQSRPKATGKNSGKNSRFLERFPERIVERSLEKSQEKSLERFPERSSETTFGRAEPSRDETSHLTAVGAESGWNRRKISLGVADMNLD